MDEEIKTYKRSRRSARVILVGVWVLVVLGMLMLNLMLGRVVDSTGGSLLTVALVIEAVVLIVLGLASFFYLNGRKDVLVELTPDSLVIHQRYGKKLMSFTHVSSVSVVQGYFGHKHDYGTLEIVFVTHEPDVTIPDVEHPNELAYEIKSRSSAKKQGSSVTMVRK